MSDLFSFVEKDPYESIYEQLRELRELFHREGRIDDSNAKLDAVVKLIAIQIATENGRLNDKESNLYDEDGVVSVERLQQLFREAAALPMFRRADGVSIFGREPSLELQPGDEPIATRLFELSKSAVKLKLDERGEIPFDMLNEAFGHFVRDTFRNNVEDAQYMTPPEVVAFMVELAMHDIAAEIGPHRERKAEPMWVLDPTCGVGSFLAAFRRAYDSKAHGTYWPVLHAIGQDKVDRMVRLSFMNMALFKNGSDAVYFGNSLVDGSEITKYNGKIDLIITNPPFGAKFDRDYINKNSIESLPIFSKLNLSSKTYNSEVLFIDRYLSLLREGGRCLVIVPDGIISAKGVPAFLRQEIARHAVLRAVIELPSVTFAQAGTRTKTAILYFQKRKHEMAMSDPVFFAEADSIGFDVFKRKGVPIKKYVGENQLPAILESYKTRSHSRSDQNKKRPFVCWKDVKPETLDAWTPRQFRVDHTAAKNRAVHTAIELLSLDQMVEQPSKKRRPEKHTDRHLYIGVLHVVGEGILDIAALKSYSPITPGIPVHPGEVIISRINPHIPRILPVPDLGAPMLCSSEFEILRPRDGFSPYMIAYLLWSEFVQEQIRALTAGTSASHSRVKPERLYQVVIPVPRRGSALWRKLEETVMEYEQSLTSITQALCRITECRSKDSAWTPVMS